MSQFLHAKNSQAKNMYSLGQRLDCNSVLFDLDLHCPQKLLVSSPVRKEFEF